SPPPFAIPSPPPPALHSLPTRRSSDLVPDFVAGAAPRGDLGGKRILFCLSPPGRPVAADVANAFKAALDRLAGLGAELEEFSGEGFDIEPIWRAINHTAWRTRFEKLAADHGNVLSGAFLKQLALATRVSGVD